MRENGKIFRKRGFFERFAELMEMREYMNTEVKTNTAEGVSVGGSATKNCFRHACYLASKRIFDIVSSGMAVIALSPVIVLVLPIRYLEDFHNLLNVSERIGNGGKKFKFCKTRSMIPDADTMKLDFIDEGKNEADGFVFKIKNDPQITKFGRFIRKTLLDEILQLLNVFKGDKNVVDSSPSHECEVKEYTFEQMRCLEVKGGALSIRQIQEDRHSIKFDDLVKYDIEYIGNQSFALDMKIIFKGAFVVLYRIGVD